MNLIIILTLFVLAIASDDLDDPDYVKTEFIKMKNKMNEMERKMQQLEDELDQYKFDICGKDWISYSNTKCFRVLDRKGSVNEAKGNCSELDESSTLITIGSLNEQNFIEKLIQKHNTLSEREVWIGLEWSDNTFKWMDGSDVKYENRGEYSNYFRNKEMQVNRCFQMTIIGKNQGKWNDDFCDENYLMACQKKQASPSNFQIDLYSHKSRLETLEASIRKFEQDIVLQDEYIENHQSRLISFETSQNNFQIDLDSQKYKLDSLEASKRNLEQDIISLEKSTIPIGFLYTQFPSQSSPDVLWPNMKWTEVTQSYAGLFFRAEGGNSSSYGQLQLASAPRLSRIVQQKNPGSFLANDNTVNIKPGKPTLDFYTGMWSGNYDKFSMSFLVSNEEVRPINKAVRIWKRTG